MNSSGRTNYITNKSNISEEKENDFPPRQEKSIVRDVPLIDRATGMHIESKDLAQQKPKNESLNQLTLTDKNAINIEVNPFKEISIKLENILNNLRNVDYRASKFNENYDLLKKDKQKLSDFKFLQKTSEWIANGKTVSGVNNLQEISEYQSLRGNRENSALENVLDKKSNFRWQLNPVNGAFRDKSTGLYAELILADPKKKEYFLCFPGTGSGNMLKKNWSTNISQVLQSDDIPPAYKQAYALAKEIKEIIENGGGSLQLSGHSLGGGIANYVGLKLDIQSFCFNAAALGGGCQEDLKNELTPSRLKKQIHINQKGDIVSSNKTQNKITEIANFINTKIVTPKNIGVVSVVSG